MTTLRGRDPHTGKAVAVQLCEGRIVSIEPSATDEECWLSAGLVDLQVNGYAGFDLNAEDLTLDTMHQLTLALLRTGVTSYLATLITQSEKRLIAALATIAKAREAFPLVKHALVGVHMEGPHLSPEDGARGAHPLEHVRTPSIDEFDRWQAASDNIIRLVTVSPHWLEAPDYIRALRDRDVLVSLGHTHADSEQVRASIDAGAQLSTHLGNGVASTLPRHPNLLWTQLADDRLTAMLIADGHHLPDDTLRVFLRAKGLERVVLVSDTVALGGCKPGRYQQPVGGDVELLANGRLQLSGTPYLAGAALPLKDGVAHLVQRLNMPLADALALASTRPAALLRRHASLEVGAPADLIRFKLDAENGFQVESTYVSGELIA
ncbi:N-acetylglucosamine-6-phosphate deacetylase [Granulicella cerasi]|uniref:N-acetylglucosamine-6-phosphate deacetylase n=1 Tax=Granulicella cerasi TaxID=741063 RepID=A0ABW1ZAW0_9BACT|nr:amidohydrolase family protein [Granulicella cerasi]